MFTRALDDRLTRVVKATEKFIADNQEKRVAGVVVLLDENNAANQAKVAEFAKANAITVPLTIAVEGAKGPAAYKLSPEVPITVLMVERKKVEANFSLAASASEEAQKKEVADILAAAAKVLAE